MRNKADLNKKYQKQDQKLMQKAYEDIKREKLAEFLKYREFIVYASQEEIINDAIEQQNYRKIVEQFKKKGKILNIIERDVEGNYIPVIDFRDQQEQFEMQQENIIQPLFCDTENTVLLQNNDNLYVANDILNF